MSVTEQMLDAAEEQAALYSRALSELTAPISPAEGAEDCFSPPKVIRDAIEFLKISVTMSPQRADTIVMLEALAHRFEEALDREDLDL